jgi:hypothetical protein
MQFSSRKLVLGFALMLGSVPGAWCRPPAGDLHGSVTDENGVPVGGAEITLQAVEGQGQATLSLTTVSDKLGHFSMENLAPGEYRITVRKTGFFVLADQAVMVQAGANEAGFTLYHEQEVHEKVEVVANPNQVEPSETAQRWTLVAHEIRDIPVPNTHLLESSLVTMPEILRDNTGGLHVAGARAGDTQYLLDGFEIGDPASGELNARFNVDGIRLAEVQSARFDGGYAHAGAGVLSLDTISGDDRWRFGTTNFVPGVHVERGWHLGNWYPRFQFSGPLVKGKAWFSDTISLQHVLSIVKEQPPGADSSTQWAGQNLLRMQWNLRRRHIVSASYLYNRGSDTNLGLDALDPVSTTVDTERSRSFVSLRDQYWLREVLVTLGVAADGGVLDETPKGAEPYILMPTGSAGNFFERLHLRTRRAQAMGSVTTTERHWHGTHTAAAGFNVSGVALSQLATRGELQALRGDGTLARLSTFSGAPALRVSNTQAGGYLQDTWTAAKRLIVQAGARGDWDRLIRSGMVGPYVAVNILPRGSDAAKLSLGWSLTNAPLNLSLMAQAFDQAQVDTLFDASGQAAVAGPVTSTFALPARGLRQPRFAITSAGWQQKLGKRTLVGLDLLAREGRRGLVYETQTPGQPGGILLLTNHRRDRYRAGTLTVRHAFAERVEIFASYTRSRARSNEVINAFLGPLQFVPEQSGPLRWDAPNRLITWGWAQTHLWGLFVSYLFEYRSGFPFSSVDQYQQIVGAPNRQRFPDYASLNLGLEKRFGFRGYVWALRGVVVNATGRENPDSVVNNITAPNYLSFAGGQARAFTARLRFVGRK